MNATQVQRWVFLLAGVAACLVAAIGHVPGDRVQIPLLLALVTVLGLPHGALDPFVARAAFGLTDRAGMAAFLSLYAALAGLVAVLWWLAPFEMLLLFLAISALHFSLDWRSAAPWPLRILLGGAVIVLPCLNHAAEVAEIFRLLADDTRTEGVIGLLSAVAPAWALALTAGSVWLLRRAAWAACEGIVLVAAGLLLPPLLFFVLYFCGLHSPRHLIDTAIELGFRSFAPVLRAALPATLATVAAAVFVYQQLELGAPSAALLKIVFIGLAALTVPHMLLIELSHRSRHRRPVAN